MGMIRGDSQHVYVDSITVNYHRYERRGDGDAINGTGFASVEYFRSGPVIRHLPGEQPRGMSPVEAESLTQLVALVERDKARFALLIDPDPFRSEEDCDSDEES